MKQNLSLQILSITKSFIVYSIGSERSLSLRKTGMYYTWYVSKWINIEKLKSQARESNYEMRVNAQP